jgi:outer membrane protein OmpA-like peptidoglycan-associated protein
MSAFPNALVAMAAIVIPLAQLAVPAQADAQLLKKIRDQVAQKVEASKARADSAAVARAGQVTDSTLAKATRGVDTAVSKTAGVADAVIDKTGEIVSSALGSTGDQQLASELETGRVVLAEVRFVGTTDQLDGASEPQLERLAKLLKQQSATFVIEGHVDDGGTVAANHALSEKRSAAVKARLVAAGVPAERLFAMGLGAARPPTDPKAIHARIEVARMK